jgi:hypothetical protein
VGGGKGGKPATKNFNNFKNGKNPRGGHHWSKSWWSDRYGCALYYDPDADGWYWWSQEDGCWCRMPDDR